MEGGNVGGNGVWMEGWKVGDNPPSTSFYILLHPSYILSLLLPVLPAVPAYVCAAVVLLLCCCAVRDKKSLRCKPLISLVFPNDLRFSVKKVCELFGQFRLIYDICDVKQHQLNNFTYETNLRPTRYGLLRL